MLKQNDKEYKKYIYKKIGIIVILFVIMISMAVFSVAKGSFNIEPLDVFKALFGKASQQINMIVLSVRLPRVAMAIISGIGLALSGCVMQSVLKNPLASASTLGISQGAAFGAAFAIVCLGAGQSTTLISTDSSLTITNPYMTTVSAFICSMLTVLIIIGLSKSRDNSPSSMVLAGVALSAMFSGGTALMQYFGTDTEIASIVFWTFGDLGRVTWKEIGIVSIVVLITSVYLPSFFIALIALYVFALKLGWFNVIGGDHLKDAVLPIAVLAITTAAWLVKQIRSLVLKEYSKDYVLAYRSRGASEAYILRKHVLRNCMLPISTLMGICVASVLGGTLMVENIFNWAGMGQLIMKAITNRDYPMIQGFLFIITNVFMSINSGMGAAAPLK